MSIASIICRSSPTSGWRDHSHHMFKTGVKRCFALARNMFDPWDRIVLEKNATVLLSQSKPLWALHLFVQISQSGDRKSTRLNSSHVKISYAVFCLKKKKNKQKNKTNNHNT